MFSSRAHQDRQETKASVERRVTRYGDGYNNNPTDIISIFIIICKNYIINYSFI